MAEQKEKKKKQELKQQEHEIKHDLKALLGHYVIQRGKALGAGSYGTVRLAVAKEGPHKDQLVAIKKIKKEKLSHTDLTKFVPREMQIMLSLHHPNIIRLLEFVETQKSAYLVLQFASGGDVLHYLIEKESKEDLLAKWFIQMLDAIHYCHKKGIAHRDLKCENLMLDSPKTLNAIVVDFGFACTVNSPDGRWKADSLSDTFCGTASYACPEIIKNQRYDPMKADVWSIGVILYCMLCLRQPFSDEETKNYKHLEAAMQRGLKFSGNVDSDAKDLIRRILTTESHRCSLLEVKRARWTRKWFDLLCGRNTFRFTREEFEAVEIGFVETASEFDQEHDLLSPFESLSLVADTNVLLNNGLCFPSQFASLHRTDFHFSNMEEL